MIGRYILVQLFAYTLELGGFSLILFFYAESIFLANIFAKILAGFFAFFSHRKFTFKCAKNQRAEYQGFKYFALLFLNAPISSYVMFAFSVFVTDWLLAKFFADVVCIFMTYLASKTLVFGVSHKSKSL